MTAADICAVLRKSQDEIIGLWEERIDREPWLRLSRDARIDHLPELLEGLADAVLCVPDEEGARRRLLVMAVRHGGHRADDGFDDTVLYEEYHILRECIWHVIERHHPGSSLAVVAISRIDMAITNSTTASLHGFHQADDEDERVGRIVHRLLHERIWPPPLGDG